MYLMGHEDSHSDALEAKEKGRLINHAECLSLCPHTSKAIRSIMKKKLNPLKPTNLFWPITKSHKTCRNHYLEFPANLELLRKITQFVQLLKVHPPK